MTHPDPADSAPPTTRSLAPRLLVALVVGGLGGGLFATLGLPLPWMLGALAATTVASMAGAKLAVPDLLRRPMIAVIGIMLGGTFTSGRFAVSLDWLVSLAALPVYVVVLGGLIFLYLRRFSGFDGTTAFFAATPGGLSEMIALSEYMGGDQRNVSMVHAMRLLLIVSAIPFLARALGLVTTPAAAAAVAPMPSLTELGLLIGLGTIGYLLAVRLRLPAATFLGPLLGSAAGHWVGWIEHQPPYFVLALAQLVIGASVGARFSGVPLGLILRSLLIGVGATTLMLAVTLVFGGILHGITGHSLILLLLALVPGGFTEMSLIALAMGVDPAFVVTHHCFRVLLVVLIAVPAFAWLRRAGWLDGTGSEGKRL
jgi:hypothetical protein